VFSIFGFVDEILHLLRKQKILSVHFMASAKFEHLKLKNYLAGISCGKRLPTLNATMNNFTKK